jgi:glycosyltransferase involved in cell wall biosynthesis
MISIIIPTLSVRKHWLERCIASYEETLSHQKLFRYEFIVKHDRPSCGVAWNEGIAEAQGDYIHLTADDIEALPGWWPPAIASVHRDELPAARILNSDGTLQSCGTDHLEHETGEEAFVARIPFATREQFAKIGPMMNEHYMGDYWFSHRGRECGYRSVVQRDYCFIHHFAQEGRIDTLAADVKAYKKRGGR